MDEAAFRASPGAIRVGRAVPGDVDALAALAACCLADAWSAAAWRAEIGRPGTCVLVARAPGVVAPLGLAGARFEADAGHLLSLAVASVWRRRGVGDALLDAVVNAARRAHAPCLHVELRSGNAVARRLYLRRGFVAVGRRPRYYRDGEDALLMTRFACGSERET